MHLTPPAVSRTLGRLRAATGDALPSFAAALAIVEGSDVVCVLPRRLGVPDGRALAVLALPFPLRSVPAVVSWHRRHDTDPAHRWLRGVIAEIIGTRLAP
jgi:DNA-binding transcriptional LysR family regulator